MYCMDFPRTCGPSLLCSLSALHVFGFGHITDISELRYNLARRLFNPNLCLIVVVVVKCQSTLRKRGRKRKSFGVKRASFASQSYAKKQRKHVCNLTTPSPGVIVVSSRASEQGVRRLCWSHSGHLRSTQTIYFYLNCTSTRLCTGVIKP